MLSGSTKGGGTLAPTANRLIPTGARRQGAPGKNTLQSERLRGRPRKRVPGGVWSRGLKVSAKSTIQQVHDAGESRHPVDPSPHPRPAPLVPGVRHAIYHDLDRSMWPAAFDNCRLHRKSHGIRALRSPPGAMLQDRDNPWIIPFCQRPPPTVNPSVWLQAHCCRSRHRKRHRDGVFVIPNEVEMEPAAKPLHDWVRFFATCRLVWCNDLPTGGCLGVVSDTPFQVGDIVIAGHIDTELFDPQSPWPTGALLGPGSMVNAACSKHCNIRFNGAGNIVATKTIRPGGPLLANYTVADERLYCPTCGVLIRGTQ